MFNKMILAIFISGMSIVCWADPSDVIEGYSRVSEGLYKGSRPTHEGVSELSQAKFKSVVDLQGGDYDIPFMRTIVLYWEPGEDPEVIAAEKSTVVNLGMKFYHFPMRSMGDIAKWNNDYVDQALKVMEDVKARPLYLHCEFGRDRTGLMVALFRVKAERLSVVEAYQEWLDQGHDGVHRMFTQDLDEYFYWKVKQFSLL